MSSIVGLVWACLLVVSIATDVRGTIATGASSGQVKVLIMSDVHYDPAYGTPDAFGHCDSASSSPWGSSGCDAPLSLIASAVHDAAKQFPDLFIMSGDWLRHNFSMLPPSAILPSFANVSELVAQVLPNNQTTFATSNFQGALGNNDFVPDYHFNLSHPTHPILEGQTAILKNLSLLAASEAATFEKCGYYARDVVPSTNGHGGLRVVVLNTVMYSVMLDPPLSPNNTDPCGQFAFLNATLADAQSKGVRVFLVAHIPPGLNLFYALLDGLAPPESLFWFDSFVLTFQSILQLYPGVVAMQFYGHTHQFSVVADAKLADAPGIIAPSITRLFGNYPSYMVATFDSASWKLVSLDQHYMNLTDADDGDAPVWQVRPAVNQIYGPFAFDSAPNLDAGCQAVEANATLWHAYETVHAGGTWKGLFPTPQGTVPAIPQGTCNDACKTIVLCSQLHVDYASITRCIASGGASSSDGSHSNNGTTPALRGGMAAAVIAAVGLCIGVAVFVKRRSKTVPSSLHGGESQEAEPREDDGLVQ